MDIRGIEVTNQLRSAIRAKLLELGVRYDEELPDYILVMVVNKKSRQQMHSDLFLFLEDSTTPFVDWLHDQVLKKLQKVTVAKKKSSKELVPTVVVKKEEDKRKRKTSTTSFLQDQDLEQPNDKPLNKGTIKLSSQDLTENQKRDSGKSIKEASSNEKSVDAAITTSYQDTSLSKSPAGKYNELSQHSNASVEATPSESVSEKQVDHSKVIRDPDVNTKHLKRPFDKMNDRSSTEKDKEIVEAHDSEDDLSPAEEDTNKRLRSAVNKPRITSVVSVKNRLGVSSPRKKFEVYRVDNKNRYAQNEKHFEKRFQNNAGRRHDFPRGRNLMVEDESQKKNREAETRPRDSEKTNDTRSRPIVTKGDRSHKPSDCREKLIAGKVRTAIKTGGTIKDRLGMVSTGNSQKQSTKSQPNQDYRNAKLEQNSEVPINSRNKNIKNRLGPLRNNFRPVISRGNLMDNRDDGDCLNLGSEEDLDDDLESVMNAGPVRSSIIAVQKPPTAQTDKKRALEKVGMQIDSDAEDEEGDVKVPSKVIVTPRPLKPLQPLQKRATQSLLLRAVAEANQSVVAKKNPEPSLLDKKSSLLGLRPVASREINQNLSVRLNASKRLVMEKIQVELSTEDTTNTNNKPSDLEQEVTQEHMGVVMSLFQRSDDKQKFLVTLNGYNNNMTKEKVESEEEEGGLQMEVGEDDEIASFSSRADMYADQNESVPEVSVVSDANDSVEDNAKDGDNENNENCNTENMEIDEEPQCKRRKLSPIIYNESPSPTPSKTKVALISKTTPSKLALKKPLRSSTPKPIVDKSREKCRYWPNCTLGNKCAYLHPAVMCSAFPACKFGGKCAYKHPQCKFGLSCTKLGCVFSHSAAKCKYHPYCTKPACPYAHPRQTAAVLSVVANNQRAKFTWRRRD